MKHRSLANCYAEVKAKETGDPVDEANQVAVNKAANTHLQLARQHKAAGNIQKAKYHAKMARSILGPVREEVGSEEKEAVKAPITTDLDDPDDVKKIKRGPEGKTEGQQAKQPLVREDKQTAVEIVQSYLDDSGDTPKEFQNKFNKFVKLSAHAYTTPSIENYVSVMVKKVFHGDENKMIKALFRFTGLSEDTVDEGIAGIKRAVKKTVTGEYGKQRKRLTRQISKDRRMASLKGMYAGDDANRHADIAKKLWGHADDAYSAGRQKEGDSLTRSAEKHGLVSRAYGRKQTSRVARVQDLSNRLKRVTGEEAELDESYADEGHPNVRHAIRQHFQYQTALPTERASMSARNRKAAEAGGKLISAKKKFVETLRARKGTEAIHAAKSEYHGIKSNIESGAHLAEDTLNERRGEDREVRKARIMNKITKELARQNHKYDRASDMAKHWSKSGPAGWHTYAQHSDDQYDAARRIDTLNGRIKAIKG